MIRKAKKSDINAVLYLQKLDKGTYWKQTDLEKAIKDKDVVFLVAEDKKVIGYIIGEIPPTKRTEAAICETRVHKKERGKRIGTKLVNELCKQCFKKGVKTIYAQIEPKHLKFYRDACKFKITHKWVEVAKYK